MLTYPIHNIRQLINNNNNQQEMITSGCLILLANVLCVLSFSLPRNVIQKAYVTPVSMTMSKGNFAAMYYTSKINCDTFEMNCILLMIIGEILL